MYGIDSDFRFAFSGGDAAFRRILETIGYHQRQIYKRARQADLRSQFGEMKGDFPEFLDPLTSYCSQSRNFMLVAPQVEIEKEKDSTAQQGMALDMGRIAVGLPALKARLIDPPVQTAEGTAPLSEIDPSYKNYLDGQVRTMKMGYYATLMLNKDFSKRICIFTTRHQQPGSNVRRCLETPLICVISSLRPVFTALARALMIFSRYSYAFLTTASIRP